MGSPRLILAVYLFALVLVPVMGYSALYRLDSGRITGIDPSALADGYWTVVRNGGAEEGTANYWYINIPSMAGLSVSTDAVAFGDYSFKMRTKVNNYSSWGVAAVGPYTSWSEPFELVVSGFVYFPEAIDGHVYIDLSDVPCIGLNGEPNNENLMADPSTPGWQFVYGIFRMTSHYNFRPRVVIDSYFKKDSVFYFDDISITGYDEFRFPAMVPEPVSGALLLMGLPFALFRRRRA